MNNASSEAHHNLLWILELLIICKEYKTHFHAEIYEMNNSIVNDNPYNIASTYISNENIDEDIRF